MRKKLYSAVLAVTLIASATIALAQDPNQQVTGNGLYDGYKAWKKITDRAAMPRDALDGGFYAGYVSGVIDAEAARKNAGVNPLWCAPSGWIYGQTFDIVGRYLESHPERRQLHRSILVYEALAQAWPCQ